MSNENLTKKEQQELRGAEAKLSRVEKLKAQLAEAQAAAGQGTIKKIEEINVQVSKLEEREAKINEQVEQLKGRKQVNRDRIEELVKAKNLLASEIAEHLTPEDHERLGLDTPEPAPEAEELPETAEDVDYPGEEEDVPMFMEPDAVTTVKDDVAANIAAVKKSRGRKAE